MHITLRVPQALLKAIDDAAARGAISRSQWIKDTIRQRIASPGTVPQRDPDLSSIQEFIEIEFEVFQSHIQSLEETRRQTETVLKLSIENVMIGRQLALLQGPAVLERAQNHARDYFLSVQRNSVPKVAEEAEESGG